MATKDYSNEVDYYSQGFEAEGVVSIWVGLNDGEGDPDDLDVLQDLCGIGYYRLDEQDANCFEFAKVSLQNLLENMSYSGSFIDSALSAADGKGLLEAKWVILQYNFCYDVAKIKRPIADDPIFLGAFSYSKGSV